MTGFYNIDTSMCECEHINATFILRTLGTIQATNLKTPDNTHYPGTKKVGKNQEVKKSLDNLDFSLQPGQVRLGLCSGLGLCIWLGLYEGVSNLQRVLKMHRANLDTPAMIVIG